MKLMELIDISYIYHSADGETEAIKGVDLTIEEGGFTAIVGPSGSGKTTLLKIMAGLIKPSRGKVLLPENVKIAYMPQRDQLFEWRNILKNVTISQEIEKQDKREAERYAEELLDKYGLGEFKKKHPSALSGGMRQRAALIRTLLSRPRLTLLDEPFSALDFQTRLYVSDDVFRILLRNGHARYLRSNLHSRPRSPPHQAPRYRQSHIPNRARQKRAAYRTTGIGRIHGVLQNHLFRYGEQR